MTEWKAGDWAMVRISGPWGAASVKIAETDISIPCSVLHPLPPGISPEAQAVLDAALRWYDPGETGDMGDEVNAYRASLSPPDLVGQLLTAIRRREEDVGLWDDVLQAVKAVEKQRREDSL